MAETSRNLVFPKDLTHGDNDTFIMFAPYKFKSEDQRADNKKKDKTEQFKAIRRIYLYHPEALQTSTMVRYSEEGTGFRDVLADLDPTSLSSLGTAGKRVFESLFAGHVGDKKQKAQGAIINPNMEIFFKGTVFREYGFSFTFAPRSKDEATTAAAIIQTFKKYSLPAQSNDGFMEYPSYWEISAISKGKELHKFKAAAIINVTLDASPNQVWSTFESGDPVAVRLDLSFKELDLITQRDFDSLPEDVYGY